MESARVRYTHKLLTDQKSNEWAPEDEVDTLRAYVGERLFHCGRLLEEIWYLKHYN